MGKKSESVTELYNTIISAVENSGKYKTDKKAKDKALKLAKQVIKISQKDKKATKETAAVKTRTATSAKRVRAVKTLNKPVTALTSAVKKQVSAAVKISGRRRKTTE
jgi:hypothetical protein